MPLKNQIRFYKKQPCIELDNVQLTENETSVLQESEMDFNEMAFNSYKVPWVLHKYSL